MTSIASGVFEEASQVVESGISLGRSGRLCRRCGQTPLLLRRLLLQAVSILNLARHVLHIHIPRPGQDVGDAELGHGLEEPRRCPQRPCRSYIRRVPCPQRAHDEGIEVDPIALAHQVRTETIVLANLLLPRSIERAGAVLEGDRYINDGRSLVLLVHYRDVRSARAPHALQWDSPVQVQRRPFSYFVHIHLRGDLHRLRVSFLPQRPPLINCPQQPVDNRIMPCGPRFRPGQAVTEYVG